MRRSYKFLLRPTAGQTRMLEACLEDTRQLYNAPLAQPVPESRTADQ